jgi:DNA-binding NarL/FixJ family response regulator
VEEIDRIIINHFAHCFSCRIGIYFLKGLLDLCVKLFMKELYGMRKIKVMLASRPKMLSDVIRNIIERQSDMILVGDVIDPIKLLFASRETAIDVVIITPLKTDGVPRICSHLLAEYPHLKILTLSETGEAAFLYQLGCDKKCIDNPSEQSILCVIRDVVSSFER